jgi:hypothetical protein
MPNCRAPRLHALGKSRGYVTISEFLFDRYLPPSGAPWVSKRREITAAAAATAGAAAAVVEVASGNGSNGRAWN